MKKKVLFISILISIQFYTFAQFSIDGEFRPRTEYNHGLKKLTAPNTDATIFTAQRTRISFNFENDFMVSKITFQDVRNWGSTPQLAASDGFSALHEAWVQVKLAKSWALKAGRQELVYDDHRIFGNVGWAHQARSHDVAVLKFDKKGIVKFDFGIAFNQNATLSDPYATAGYKAMQYFWLQKDLGKYIDMSFLSLNNGLQYQDPSSLKYSVLYSQTTGARFTVKPKENLDINLAAYYQDGKDGSDKDLTAYYVAASATLGLLDKDKLKLTAGMELLSGTDRDSTIMVNNSFTPLYGTNHKFNGHMDYFYVGSHVGNVGLQDIYFKAAYKVGKMTPGIDFHIFSAAAILQDQVNNKVYESLLGYEIDFSVGYKLNDFVSFKAGYSQMLATESMEFLKGGSKDEKNNWGWLMLSVSPKFFESK